MTNDFVPTPLQKAIEEEFGRNPTFRTPEELAPIWNMWKAPAVIEEAAEGLFLNGRLRKNDKEYGPPETHEERRQRIRFRGVPIGPAGGFMPRRPIDPADGLRTSEH